MQPTISRRQLLIGAGVAGLGVTGVGTATADHGGGTAETKPTSHIPPDDVAHDPVTPTVTNQPADGETQHSAVLLIKDCHPWDTQANEVVLDEMGQPYDLITSDQVGEIDLGAYAVVIIPSTQSNDYYDQLAAHEAAIKGFVENGGTLVAHAAPGGYPCSGHMSDSFLPQEVGVTQYDPLSDLTIAAPESPIVSGLDNDLIDGWNASAHGWLQSLPTDYRTIIEAQDGTPVYIEYGHGAGTVLATTVIPEWCWNGGPEHGQRLLRNELPYALEGADGGGSQEVLFTADFEQTAPGNYPAEWIPNGNEDQGVVEGIGATGQQALRTAGRPGGCWEAIANHPLQLPQNGTVVFSGAVGPTTDGEIGCHEGRGDLTLRTTADGWDAGQRARLFKLRPGGTVQGPTGVDLGPYQVDTWNTFEVMYHRSDSEVTLEYVINGSTRDTVSRSVHDYEDDLEFLALSSDDVAVYWDDLRVVQMTGDTGPELPSIGGLENPPTDPDNDGVYEDINGDGQVDIVDVQGFFNNYEGETVQNNPDAFDFNGDGSVNIVDVQQLFSEL